MFIVFEGGEGAGKSSQVRHLYGLLCQQGYRARMLREPGSTTLGEGLRHLVTMPRQTLASRWQQGLFPPQSESQIVAKELWLPVAPVAEVFLFAAARAQLVWEVVQPSLQQDVVLLCERYVYSTLAYQGYGRGMDLDFLRQVNQIATQGIVPDLIVLLDMKQPSSGILRKRNAGEVSRFEEEELEFHNRVRQGYLKLAGIGPEWSRRRQKEGYIEVEHPPGRWLVINASLPRKEIGQIIWERVQPLLPPRPKKPKRKEALPTTPLLPSEREAA